MISAPESRQSERKAPEHIDNCISYGMATGGLSGSAFSIYKGMTVTGCAASGCSLCCVETCCSCTCKSLYCFAISSAGFGAGVFAGSAAGLALGYCSSDHKDKETCWKILTSLFSTDHNAEEDDVLLHPVQVVDSDAEHSHGNESVVITSQPTVRESQAINGSDSSPGHLHPEVRYTSDATAMNNGHSSTDGYPASPLYYAPPSYKDSVGPPPSYEENQYN